MLNSGNMEAVRSHLNDFESIRTVAMMSDASGKNLKFSDVSGIIAIYFQGYRKDPNRQNKWISVIKAT